MSQLLRPRTQLEGGFDRMLSVCLHAPVQRATRHIHAAAEFEQRHPLAFVLDRDALARVHALLLHRGPATVVRRIGAVVVASLNGVSPRGSATHVSDERREVVTPALAHSNAASTVALVGYVGLCVTPVQHRLPRSVLWRQIRAVLSRACHEDFVLQAAATPSGTRAVQICSAHDCFSSARAATSPEMASAWRRHAFDDRQPPEALPADVWCAIGGG